MIRVGRIAAPVAAMSGAVAASLGLPLAVEIAGDAAALDALRRETRRSRQLTHQPLVRIHDLFEAEGEAPFISMEYVEGPNLSEFSVRSEGGVLA